MSGTLWIGFVILFTAVLLDIIAPQTFKEGFQALTTTAATAPEPVLALDTKASFLTKSFARRGDVGPMREWKGYTADKRYFSGYADVQRIGAKNDYCRVVTNGLDDDAFFACSLAGTVGLDPYTFKTRKVAEGLRLSRDDYMRDIRKEGRDAYCRILKGRDGLFLPYCLRATDTGFSAKDELDTAPPEEILTLVDFYSGCKTWLRMRDDLVDYTNTLQIQKAGGIEIDHTPRPTITRGLSFNGKDQFLRIGDSSELSLGNKIKMRTIRAFSVWAYFNEFTNNAHIFDFGDGPGLNNTFLGILGKGDAGMEGVELRAGPKCQESTVPVSPSGAQWCPELRPEELLKNSAANVDEYVCPGPETNARRLEPLQTRPLPPTGAVTRATLLFEIWDQKLRKVQIKVNRAVPLQKWVHIVVTARNMDAARPDLLVYMNGNLIHVAEEAFLPQARVTSNNYLGKSNWSNATSEYELRDELFSGQLFDFRMYETALSETKIKRTLQWGMGKLGLDNSFASVVG